MDNKHLILFCIACRLLKVALISSAAPQSICRATSTQQSGWKDISRRARLVATATGLENQRGFTLLVGSDPPLAFHQVEYKY
jgi:hypothetical protein